jgi:TRAP-type C4-dicarboxylate transport system substrate-binding protein
MRHRTTVFTALCVLLLCLGSTFALTIKLGSLAPNGSPWDKALRKIAAEWSTISKGKIKLKIYPGDLAGSESDMLRKMRIGQLHAAGLTGIGMCRVFSGILAVQVPLVIKTDEELYYVLDKMKPKFEKELEEKGFTVLMWSKVGWVHFFSKNPVVTPDDLKKHKLWNYAGDPDGTQAWKKAGFHPVPLSPTELMTSLQSGMVDAFSTTPLSAAANQWFGLAKNMCGMNWAPLIGGIVVSTKTWKKIPEKLRVKLLAAAMKVGEESQVEIDKADAQALKIMQDHGLKVHPVSEEVEAQWQNVIDSGFDLVIGKSFDEASYNEVKKHLKDFRESNGQ